MIHKFISFLLLPIVVVLLIAQTLWQAINFFITALKQNTHEVYTEYKTIWHQRDDSDDLDDDLDDDFWNAK